MADTSTNRWMILAVLFMARFALGFHFQSIGSVAPMLIDRFALDYAQVGLLIGLIMVPGIVLALPASSITHRMGDRRVVMLGLALMIVGGVLTSLAQTQWELMLGRLVGGGGAALLIVLMTKMVIDWFGGKDLYIAMGIFTVGLPVGIASGQLVQGAIAEASNWKVPVVVATLVCLISFILVDRIYRSPGSMSNKEQTDAPRLTRKELLLINAAGAIWMLFNGAYFVMLSFGPTMLIDGGHSMAAAGIIVSSTSWAFIIGLPLGGVIAARSRTPDTIITIGLSCAAVLGALLPYGGASPIIGFSAYGLALGVSAPVVASLPSRILRKEVRARGLGYYFTWFFVGVSLLPAVGGYLRDATGSANSSVQLSAALSLACLFLIGIFRITQSRMPVSALVRS